MTSALDRGPLRDESKVSATSVDLLTRYRAALADSLTSFAPASISRASPLRTRSGTDFSSLAISP